VLKFTNIVCAIEQGKKITKHHETKKNHQESYKYKPTIFVVALLIPIIIFVKKKTKLPLAETNPNTRLEAQDSPNYEIPKAHIKENPTSYHINKVSPMKEDHVSIEDARYSHAPHENDDTIWTSGSDANIQGSIDFSSSLNNPQDSSHPLRINKRSSIEEKTHNNSTETTNLSNFNTIFMGDSSSKKRISSATSKLQSSPFKQKTTLSTSSISKQQSSPLNPTKQISS
jgi:hypothetical protein